MVNVHKWRIFQLQPSPLLHNTPTKTLYHNTRNLVQYRRRVPNSGESRPNQSPYKWWANTARHQHATNVAYTATASRVCSNNYTKTSKGCVEWSVRITLVSQGMETTASCLAEECDGGVPQGWFPHHCVHQLIDAEGDEMIATQVCCRRLLVWHSTHGYMYAKPASSWW